MEKLLQQLGRTGLNYQKPEAKVCNLSPFMVLLSLSDLFVLYFLSRMELLLLLPSHHIVKELFKEGTADFCSSSPLPPDSPRRVA